jgi:hypothetical protein
MGCIDMGLTRPNTIRNRGLQSIFNDYVHINNCLSALLDPNLTVITVYKGAHSNALDTIAWFAYGIKPQS